MRVFYFNEFFKSTLFYFSLLLPVLGQAQQFSWARSMGGGGQDYAFGLAADQSGNVFGTGHFAGSADFDPGLGVQNISASASTNIYINSLDAQGNYRWAYGFGTSGFNFGRGIAVGPDGSVYAIGEFEGTIDFNPGLGTNNLTANNVDIFIIKFSNEGVFQWVKNFGGDQVDVGRAIACGPDGSIYVSSSFRSSVNINTLSGPISLTAVGTAYDVLNLKLNPAGDVIWAKAFGGDGNNVPSGITVDMDGNVVTTGHFTSTINFQTGAGPAVESTSNGSSDAFVHKLAADGSFLWARAFGGSGIVYSQQLTVDAENNILVTGFFRETADFDFGPGVTSFTSAGINDCYISKISSSGDFLWAKAFGGESLDVAYGVQVDLSNNIYLTGTFGQTADFDPGPSQFNATSAGSGDVFLLQLDNNGNFIHVITYGSTSDDRAEAMCKNANGEIFISGRYFNTVDFNPPNQENQTAVGLGDMFIVKYTTNCLEQTPAQEATACGSYQWNSQTYNSSGTYSYTSPGVNGECDTLYTLNLSITSFDNQITLNGNQLSSNLSGVNFQWLNCNNAFAPIAGATSATFTPVQTGNYALQVSASNCADTSNCVNVTITGIQSIGEQNLELFPNPTKDFLTIQFSEAIRSNGHCKFYQISGSIIYEQSIPAHANQIQINTSDFPDGVYLVRVWDDIRIYTRKMIIQH